MMRSPALRVALLALLLTLLLVAMIGRQQYTLATGTTVFLETVPVDPHDLFRGEYVRLTYSIASIEPSVIGSASEIAHGAKAFVTLKPGEPYWTAVAVSPTYPRVEPGNVVLEGEVDWGNMSDGLHIRYGIESYYVPEGAGRAIEEAVRDKKVDIAVAVDRFGHGAIKALMVDGKPVYAESLF
jgi:uncharacterized membrane-anchored protein